MSSAQQQASERRAAATAELTRLGVVFRVEYGFWTVTTHDGEEYPDLTVSHVEWYCRGLRDGMGQTGDSW